ncbi:MAG: DUF924 family protein [Nevskiales bacterium]
MSIPTQAILDCWFGNSAEQPQTIPKVSGKWFVADEQFDQQLRDQFEAALMQAAADADWNGSDIHERLARILLLDQVSRNIYRGTPRAFATDALALKLCQDAIESGDDTRLTPIERSFLAMPLQHAEDREIQKLSVSYFSHLVATARHPAEETKLRANADYAQQHADIVQRFGRYPHRNKLLGRESSEEEQRYLNEGAPRFGQ